MKLLLEQITASTCWLADGGWGTEFQKLGLPAGLPSEQWNLLHPEKVADVVRSYLDAGADIVLTNTFGGNRFVLERRGLAEKLDEVNLRGAEISRRVAGDQALVFGSMGPTGMLLDAESAPEQEVFESYRRQSQALWRGGVDALLIETMIDVSEMKIAARAARENTPLPLALSMTFDSGRERDRTMMGVTPEQAVAEMEAVGAWIVGANCGVGPEFYVNVCRRIRAVTAKPIWVKANAGIPREVDNKIAYPMGPEAFAKYGLQLRDAGANVIGGCCGTTPEHIRHLRALLGYTS